MRVSYTSNIADQFTQNMKYVILQTGITALEIHIFFVQYETKICGNVSKVSKRTIIQDTAARKIRI
jgi:hypothetical protein